MKLFSSHISSAPAPIAKGTDIVSKQQDSSSSGSEPTEPYAYTIEDVRKAVPSHIRSSISQSLVDTLNNIANDPFIIEDIRNNFISYSAVLKEGKFKIEDYLNAVAYVSFKLMNNTNEEAYAKTFPQRYAALIAKGTAKKDIASYISGYNRGKLVNLILEQTLVPSWVLNQDLYQKAINVQAEMMQTAKSEKVRVEAANSLLTHLSKPKEGSFQINIGETENTGMREMRDMIRQLAVQQQMAIQSGKMQTIEVSAQRIRNDEEMEG